MNLSEHNRRSGRSISEKFERLGQKAKANLARTQNEKREKWNYLKDKHPDIARVLEEVNRVFGRPASTYVEIGGKAFIGEKPPEGNTVIPALREKKNDKPARRGRETKAEIKSRQYKEFIAEREAKAVGNQKGQDAKRS